MVHETLYFGGFALYSEALVARLMPLAGFEVTQLSLTSLMSSANIGLAVGLERGWVELPQRPKTTAWSMLLAPMAILRES